MLHPFRPASYFQIIAIAILAVPIGCSRPSPESAATEPSSRQTQPHDALAAASDSQAGLSNHATSTTTVQRPLGTTESNTSKPASLPQIGTPEPAYLEMGTRRTGDPEDDSRPQGGDFDFDRLLASVVTPEGLVRYEMFDDLSIRQRLQGVVDAYAVANLPEETPDRLARWINAYNANVMLLAYRASRNPGFQSVNASQGFFNKTLIRVAGESMTLDSLRDDRIRSEGDPRVHAAIVFGAKGCPPLLHEPYAAENLDEQLDDQCRRWVNDRSRNSATFPDDSDSASPAKMLLSEIFNWHSSDFDRLRSTTGEVGIRAFLADYVRPTSPLGRVVTAPTRNQSPIEWLPFDWSLNAAPVETVEPVK